MSAPREPARVPVIVAAKNEERSIGRTLEALLASCEEAERLSELRFDVRVVLDDTDDGTESVVLRYPGVTVLRSSGGKVEAQRVGLAASDDAPFAIFCDADVLPSRGAVHALASLLVAEPDVEVATPVLVPLPPRRSTPLARALHTYNRRRGFSSSRSWFNGKLFAIRRWSAPSREELAARIASLAPDPFYDFERGLVVDDVFLSRMVVLARGEDAIREAPGGQVRYRAPETWRGMNRYYRRMRRELERLDVLFPESVAAHRAHGRRAPDLLRAAPPLERMHHALFQVALAGCRAAYVAERAWVRHVRRAPRGFWPPVEETKAW